MSWWRTLVTVYVVGVVVDALLQLISRHLARRGDPRFTAFTNRAILLISVLWPVGVVVWFWMRVVRRVPPPGGW